MPPEPPKQKQKKQKQKPERKLSQIESQLELVQDPAEVAVAVSEVHAEPDPASEHEDTPQHKRFRAADSAEAG